MTDPSKETLDALEAGLCSEKYADPSFPTDARVIMLLAAHNIHELRERVRELEAEREELNGR